MKGSRDTESTTHSEGIRHRKSMQTMLLAEGTEVYKSIVQKINA